MRIIFYLTLVTLLFSCSKNNEQEKTIYDFGMVEYEEPFRGILKSQPSILKQSLKYPPYKWLAPDTISLQKTFIVDFNEDAVRSNAKATLYFVDLNNSPLDGISFRLADGSISENLVTIVADSLRKEITIICDIHPSIGEQVKTGKITIAGNNLDQINSSSLQQDLMMLAEWKVEQKLNIPWLLWLLWLITLVLIIIAIVYIAKYLFMLITKFANMLSSMSFERNISTQNVKHKNSKKNKHYRPQDTVEQGDEDLLLELEKKLYSDIRVADKYDILETIRLALDSYYILDRTKYEKYKKLLKAHTWDALEDAWKLWDPTPKSNGKWEKTLINDTFILNENHKYYKECCDKNFKRCTYNVHGSPDFDLVTYPNSVVDISDLYDSLSIESIKKRGGSRESLQELAQDRVAKQLEPILRKWAQDMGIPYNQYDCYYKWRDLNDLVPHEDTNCRTLRLVYRSVHKAFTHRGGVSNAINIKKHFSRNI